MIHSRVSWMFLPVLRVHHRVAAPADGPGHLLHFFLDAGTERGVADVGVDLHQEVAADDHRLALGVVDVGGDDGAAGGDLRAHEFGRDLLGHRLAEVLAGMLLEHHLGKAVALLVLADGDVFHLRRDDALARIVHLRDVLAGLGLARRVLEVEAHIGQCRVVQALLAVFGSQARQRFGVVALGDPSSAQFIQTGTNVDLHRRVGIGAGAVIDVDGWVLLHAIIQVGVGQRDLAHRHANVGPAAFNVDLARIRQGFDRGFIDMRGSS